MSQNDDIIRRWLDEAADDAPPRLDRDGESNRGDVEGTEAEDKALRDRLRIVQGLLSTLDRKSAPEGLDDWFGVEPVQSRDAGSGEVAEIDLASWLEGTGAEGLFVPQKAPEFLDRLVEQRLAGMGQDPSARPMGAAKRTARRLLVVGASLAALLLLAPFFLGSDAVRKDAPVRLVSYNSLEGLQKAFPRQSQVADSVGILGAFGVPGAGSGVVR